MRTPLFLLFGRYHFEKNCVFNRHTFIDMLIACLSKKSDNNTTPTGYPSNEIDQPQIMYNDTIFYYWATGFDEELPNNYIYVGTVEEVDNETPPSENFVGSRIDVGQKIYADDKKSDTIYVEYENGYARFSLSSTQK